MYSDIKRKNTIKIILVLMVILLIGLMAFVFKDSGRDLSEESDQAIQETVKKGALQCYVVEGVYPPDLKYLEDNYGLKINTEDFYVTYDAFASNLPPTVIVSPRNSGGEAAS